MGGDGASGDGDVAEVLGQLHHHIGHASVSDQNVAAQAHDVHGDLRIAAKGQDGLNLGNAVGLYQQLGRTTDLKGGVVGHGLVYEHGIAADDVAECLRENCLFRCVHRYLRVLGLTYHYRQGA